jgi:hypothetical protein
MSDTTATSDAYAEAEERAQLFASRADLPDLWASKKLAPQLRGLLMQFRLDRPLQMPCQACGDEQYHYTRMSVLIEAAQLARDRSGILYSEGFDAEAAAARLIAGQLLARATEERTHMEQFHVSDAHTCGGPK